MPLEMHQASRLKMELTVASLAMNQGSVPAPLSRDDYQELRGVPRRRWVHRGARAPELVLRSAVNVAFLRA